MVEADNIEGRERWRGWATGRGQKKNGEMIKYSGVKFSRPNSVRLPIQYPLANICLSVSTLLRLGKIEATNRELCIYPAVGRILLALGFLLSQCPAFLVPFARIRSDTSSQMKGPHQIGPLV